MVMTKYQKNPYPYITADLVDDICEMFYDGVRPKGIAEWLGLPKVTVTEILKDHFPTDIYGCLIPPFARSPRFIMPKITEPDIFACQLALLKSIGDNAVQDFFDKVRENYPTVTLAIENTPARNDFYTTPELEIETDLENDWLVGNGYGEFYPLENSADYNRLG
jgi:hypothetical protein